VLKGCFYASLQSRVVGRVKTANSTSNLILGGAGQDPPYRASLTTNLVSTSSRQRMRQGSAAKVEGVLVGEEGDGVGVRFAHPSLRGLRRW